MRKVADKILIKQLFIRFKTQEKWNEQKSKDEKDYMLEWREKGFDEVEDEIFEWRRKFVRERSKIILD